ncbi:MAG: flavodoxin family protein [Alcanivorax sp.]|jgi:multimeric flavodoxin WrbA|nr:MAG: flavodoxin [Oceanobacter sp.]
MTQRKTLLFIAHTPSPNLERLANAFIDGVTAAQCSNIDIRHSAPLTSNADELNTASAVVLLTPENLGYMSGAMKDWFDRIYYPCLDSQQGLPVAAIIKAGHDGTGTHKALSTITTGLRWRWVQAPLICKGEWQDSWLEDVHDLGSAMAVGLSEGMM